MSYTLYLPLKRQQNQVYSLSVFSVIASSNLVLKAKVFAFQRQREKPAVSLLLAASRRLPALSSRTVCVLSLLFWHSANGDNGLHFWTVFKKLLPDFTIRKRVSVTIWQAFHFTSRRLLLCCLRNNTITVCSYIPLNLWMFTKTASGKPVVMMLQSPLWRDWWD